MLNEFTQISKRKQNAKWYTHNIIHYQWCGWGSFHETEAEAEAEAALTSQGEAAQNQAEARPRQGSQKTM